MIKAPTPLDVQDLKFKLQCRLKVFNNLNNTSFRQHCSLVTCASRYRLIFVATSDPSSIQAIQLSEIENCSTRDCNNTYRKRNFPVDSPPTHLSINQEQNILAAIIEKSHCQWAVFLKTKTFYDKKIMKLHDLQLSETYVKILQVTWNPLFPSDTFTVLKSDGIIGIYELKGTGITTNELKPPRAHPTCFCWDLKGRQLIVGSRDGTITIFESYLTVKVINPPSLMELHSLKSLQCLSKNQFIGIFEPLGPDGRTQFIIIKSQPRDRHTYINYDDICHSNGNVRPVQFFMIFIEHWKMLLTASSNSKKIGVLGLSNNSWIQLIPTDAAELFSNSNQQPLPVGITLDTGSPNSPQSTLPWVEPILSPNYKLFVVSNDGILYAFNIIKLIEENWCPPTAVAQLFPKTSTINLKSLNSENSTSSLTATSSLVEASSNSPNLRFTKTQSGNLFKSHTTSTSISSHPFMPQYQSSFFSFSSGEVKNAAIVPMVQTSGMFMTSAVLGPFQTPSNTFGQSVFGNYFSSSNVLGSGETLPCEDLEHSVVEVELREEQKKNEELKMENMQSKQVGTNLEIIEIVDTDANKSENNFDNENRQKLTEELNILKSELYIVKLEKEVLENERDRYKENFIKLQKEKNEADLKQKLTEELNGLKSELYIVKLEKEMLEHERDRYKENFIKLEKEKNEVDLKLKEYEEKKKNLLQLMMLSLGSEVTRLDSTLCSYYDLQQLKPLYPTIVSVEGLERYNSKNQKILVNLEVIWKLALNVCEEAQFFAYDQVSSFLISKMWRFQFHNESFEMLLNRLTE